MEAIRVDLPLSKEAISSLRAGDVVSLCGTAYTARDAAHKRLFAMIFYGAGILLEVSFGSML